MRFCDIHLRTLLQWAPKLLFCIRSLNNILLKSSPHFPGDKWVNSLTMFGHHPWPFPWPQICIWTHLKLDKQRFLTPGHQGWNDLHSLCRIGMEYYLLNNDDNNIIYWIMMIIMIMMMIIIMMTMMIIGTATIMIMIIIITTTLTMTIMKMIMIKTAQTPCQSLYKDRRI